MTETLSRDPDKEGEGDCDKEGKREGNVVVIDGDKKKEVSKEGRKEGREKR